METPGIEVNSWVLTLLGGGLLLGLFAHIIGRRAHIPRVTLLLLLGVMFGPSALDVVPQEMSFLFPVVAQVALSMVGFSLGQHFEVGRLRSTGPSIVAVAIVGTLIPAVVVVAGLLLFGSDPLLAIALGSLAAATDPASTIAVIRETGAKGELAETIAGVVAIDDAAAIILFSVLMVLAEFLVSGTFSPDLLFGSLFEVVGALVLGVALGLPMAWVTRSWRDGELTLIEGLGFVLLAGGISGVIGVSYLLTCMMMGVVVANWAPRHDRLFHTIEGAMDPFLIVFFLLAGFEFKLSELVGVGTVGLVYIVARSLGKVVGGWLGAKVGGASVLVTRHIGWCLLPQAGVALGMGLVAVERFPELGGQLLTLLIGATVVFEIFGPVATRMALVHSGEVKGPA